MESPWEKYQKLLLLSMFSDKLQRREVPNLCNKGTITFLELLFIFSQATAELPIKLDRHEKWVYVVILLKDLPQTKKVDRTKSNPSLKKKVVKFYQFCNGENHKFVYLNDIFLSKSKLFSSHNLGLTYQSSFWAFKPVYTETFRPVSRSLRQSLISTVLHASLMSLLISYAIESNIGIAYLI